jgi:hypothetical protein
VTVPERTPDRESTRPNRLAAAPPEPGPRRGPDLPEPTAERPARPQPAAVAVPLEVTERAEAPAPVEPPGRPGAPGVRPTSRRGEAAGGRAAAAAPSGPSAWA